MRYKFPLFIITAFFFLQGCTNMNYMATKSIDVKPSAEVSVVKADAHTVCKDYFFVMKCETTVDLNQVVKK